MQAKVQTEEQQLLKFGKCFQKHFQWILLMIKELGNYLETI